jgi:HK97 family phage major capsid protein
MAIEEKDVKQVADELGAKFTEFKKQNDKRIDAITSEKATLAESVSGLSETVKNLQKSKDTLQDQLTQFQLKSNRPGSTELNQDQTEHKEAFGSFMRKGHEDGLQQLEQKALSVGTNADGGFAVPEELDRNIIELLRDATPMRQAAHIMTIGGSDYKKLVNLHGTGSGWVGETVERPATNTPTLAQIAPFMGEIYANPQVTQQMLDDGFFNVEQWLAQEVQNEFSEKENTAFTLGDGILKPKGFLAYATAATGDKTRAFGTLEHRETAGVGSVSADDIVKLIFALKKAYRNGASFMGSTDLLSELMVLKDSTGQYLWRAGLEIGESSTLRGYKYEENEDMPDVAAGALPLSFSNFKRGYTIVDRMGTRVLRDPYTNKPFVGFYTTKRVGGFVTDSQAIKLLKVKAV